jgi:hypothetical protein
MVKLDRALQEIRRCGYALDQQEITRGIVCVAAPVRNREGKTIAAISAAFPAYIEQERGIKDEIRAVTQCAEAISAQLQGAPVQEGDDRAAPRRRDRERTPQPKPRHRTGRSET